MIRKYRKDDIEILLDIWLRASIEAHDFIAPDFWRSQVNNMRNIYIPASENYVYERESKVLGFYSLHENTLAAIFVSPENQRAGIGKQLMNHAKKQRENIVLSVYKENEPSFNFYLSQGFTVVSEQIDEHTERQEYTMSTSI